MDLAHGESVTNRATLQIIFFSSLHNSTLQYICDEEVDHAVLEQNTDVSPFLFAACEEGPGICSHLLTLASVLIIMATLPLSLLMAVKVVQEYERAVIFRLGRLLSGGARGPGVFFIIPCVDIYEKIDMRIQTYEIPPQEVI